MLPPTRHVSLTINQSASLYGGVTTRLTAQWGRRRRSGFPHMSSSVMQELLAQSSFDKLKEGAIVPGVITEIRQNEVVVDIGGKSEGVIPAHEFLDIRVVLIA